MDAVRIARAWGHCRRALVVAWLSTLLAAPALGAGPATVIAPAFDHLTTGFELVGQHRDLACETCHVNAVFRGTPRDCAACHGVGTAVRASAKPATHILSTQRCESCHTPVGWTPAVNFSHLDVHGSCSSCHNNVQAQGKGSQHFVTNLECDTCHSTLGWAGAAFSHTGISGGCAMCHNGIKATGMPTNHIPVAAAPCESCHSATDFTTFRMANVDANMHHSMVGGMPCSSCHEKGKSFIGTPPVVTRPVLNHVQTGECSSCHFSTTSFLGATNLPADHIPLPAADNGNCALCHSNANDYSVYAMNHANIASNCAQCHAAGLSFANMIPPVLKELPANHIPVGTVACESCHSTSNFTSFSGTAMNHAAVSSVSCASCHASGKSFVGAPPVRTMPANHIPTGTIACQSCHSATNFTSFAMPDTDANMNHTVVSAIPCSSCHEEGQVFVGAPPVVTRPTVNHVQTGECSNCHFSTTSFLGATNLPANHIPLPAADNGNCALCHSNANDYSVYAMNHANIASNCAQCHAAGLAFDNMAPPVLKELPANHIPVGSVACESCHSTSNFTSFSGTAMTMRRTPFPRGVWC